MPAGSATRCGHPVERVEDSALPTARRRFIDDRSESPDTLHAAILRSPHAHARINRINPFAARTLPAAPSERELREFPGGHLWRRSGYARIVAALDTAARLRQAEPHA